MGDTPLHIARYSKAGATIVPNHGTRGVVLYAPGGNGGRMHGMRGSNSNSGATIELNVGVVRFVTVQDATNTGTLGCTASTITRLNGSWVSDFMPPSFNGGLVNKAGIGLVGGETLMLLDAATVANRGAMGRLTDTGVAATTLTFASNIFSVENALPAGARLGLLLRSFRHTVEAGRGYSLGSSAKNLFTNAFQEWLADRPDAQDVIGPNEAVVGWVTSAIAAGHSLDVALDVGAY